MPRNDPKPPLHPVHPRTSAEVETGSRVVIRDAFGRYHDRIALTGVVHGRDFLVIWVAREKDVATAEAWDSESGALPWPAEDVWIPGEEPRGNPAL